MSIKIINCYTIWFFSFIFNNLCNSTSNKGTKIIKNNYTIHRHFIPNPIQNIFTRLIGVNINMTKAKL